MPRPVIEEHSELAHYTSAAGLTGILATQSLWATHASFLNDSTEIRLFFDRRLRPLIEEAVRKEWPARGEAATVTVSEEIASSIRETTLKFSEPYILSFCSAQTQRSRVDGLLSQWRAYGKQGGYAIFFDTVELEKLLLVEVRDYWYQHVQWGEVHYHQDDADAAHAAEEIVEAERKLQRTVVAAGKNPKPEELEPLFEPVLTLCCLYKHWGFHEEREVRVIAIPPNADLLREGRASGEARPCRVSRTFVRDGCPVPYIDLFGRASPTAELVCLPITRVLVGPHPQADNRKRAVEIMLEACGIKASVAVSQIPYIGG